MNKYVRLFRESVRRLEEADEAMARQYELQRDIDRALTKDELDLLKKYNSLPFEKQQEINRRLEYLIDTLPGHDNPTRALVKDTMFNGMGDMEQDFDVLSDKQYDDLIKSSRK